MKKIICIGSATKDIFVLTKDTKIIDNAKDQTAKRLMAFEFGAKIYAEKLVETVGGTAINISAGLKKIGFTSFAFSRTSKNQTGEWILKGLGKLKIKKNFMQQNGGLPAEVSVIISDTISCDHTIFRTGDSVENFDQQKALKKFHEKVDGIFVGSLKVDWQKKLEQILAFAEKKKALIAFNPSGYQISNDAKALASILKKIQIIFLNRDEAIEFIEKVEGSVEDEPKQLIEKLHALGCQVVALTDAENGAYVSDKKVFLHLGTTASKKIDSTGAGDAFSSAFLAAYIEKKDLRQALAWGIANSGNVVGKIGSIEGLLNKKQLLLAEKTLLEKIKEF